MFEKEFEKFLAEQKKNASKYRLERLNKDLIGEKKLLKEVIWPVLKSFDDLILEHELLTSNGVRIFIDVFYKPLGFGFESEGYVPHAETITRERFTFERNRIRTMLMYGYKYVPFSWDELDKSPMTCRRSFYELLGRYSNPLNAKYTDLTVKEREVVRYSITLGRPFRLADINFCLQCDERTSRRTLNSMMEKNLVKPLRTTQRIHEYILEQKAVEYIL